MTMDRRDFIRNGALSAAAIAGAKQVHASPTSVRGEENEIISPFELEEKTIADLQKMMSSGQMSSRQITLRYLTRIGQLNKRGPALHAVIETNPDALAI